jgi:hypothetical protein
LTDDAAAELFVLADGVPADEGEVAPDEAVQAGDGLGGWTALLWIGGVCFAALVICWFWYIPVRTWDLVGTGLGVAVVAYPVFLLMSVLLLRGASTSHDRLAPLVIVGVFLMALGSIGGVALVNGMADNSPPRLVTVPIIEKHLHRGRRGSTSYSITVRSWDRQGETVNFSVSFDEYNRVTPNRSQLELATGRGALGIEWVIGRQLRF